MLFAGYVGPGKGVDVLLDAWRVVAAGTRLPLLIAGTNTGGMPQLNIPANGKPFTIESWSIYRLEDGKVVEHKGITTASR